MQHAHDQATRIRIPEQLVGDVRRLGAATGRGDFDIMTSALRTYLADRRQRDAVAAHFHAIPTGYPSAFVVTARCSLRNDAVFGAAAQRRAEATFGQINRYAPTRTWWSSDGRSVVVDLAVSGRTAEEAAATAAKMMRNRIVDELGLAAHDDLEVEVLATDDIYRG